MKDRASRIADAAQTHAFAISWQPRVLFIEDLSSLTGLHRESAANECVRLKSEIIMACCPLQKLVYDASLIFYRFFPVSESHDVLVLK
ncbi:hypothetical protein Y032_0010g862 [Ancylostoma ceylanicum]|uniref:Uncharacterized protein n=1 Tax=Ancylostoma ceylanicum TaxID=53326 RepID=A0A016VHY6_9BILA|nr:hypothetical protein Y032_0010g862 [Ancylostoma ceylanicum]